MYFKQDKKITKCPKCGAIVDEFLSFSRFLSYVCRKCDFEKRYDLMTKKEIDKKVNIDNILRGE